jgi:hypothetical protein
MGWSAAAPNRFCCESSFDVVVYRLDCDASRFAFGITFQLARVDKFVLFLRETWIALIACFGDATSGASNVIDTALDI